MIKQIEDTNYETTGYIGKESLLLAKGHLHTTSTYRINSQYYT